MRELIGYLSGGNQLLADEAIESLTDASQNETLWALNDHLGTVRDLVDNGQQIRKHTEYSGFGEVTGETFYDLIGNVVSDAHADAVEQLFGYTGHALDETDGTNVTQHRRYDSATAVWLSTDPSGFDAGDANLYRYVGNKSTTFVDPDGLAEFPIISIGGEPVIVTIPIGGSRGADSGAANRLASKNFKGFSGGGALNGAWHHSSFDRQSGTFVMQLVEARAHRASHTGAFCEYLDWASDIINNGDFDSLDEQQLAAIKKSLSDKKTMRQLGPRLSKHGITVAKSAKDIVVSKGGNPHFTISRSVARGRWVTAVIRRAGSAVSVLFAVGAAADARAEGGGLGDVTEAAGREFIAADMWEAGFELTVVNGCEHVFTRMVPKFGAGVATQRRIQNLPESQRNAIIREYQTKQLMTLSEMADEADQKGAGNLIGGAWDDFWPYFD